MLYLVAHSFFNGQSKNSNLFSLPELHETQFKQNRGALGTRMASLNMCSVAVMSCVAVWSSHLVTNSKRVNLPPMKMRGDRVF